LTEAFTSRSRRQAQAVGKERANKFFNFFVSFNPFYSNAQKQPWVSSHWQSPRAKKSL